MVTPKFGSSDVLPTYPHSLCLFKTYNSTAISTISILLPTMLTLLSFPTRPAPYPPYRSAATTFHCLLDLLGLHIPPIHIIRPYLCDLPYPPVQSLLITNQFFPRRLQWHGRHHLMHVVSCHLLSTPTLQHTLFKVQIVVSL